tara:strand:- start:409 stop:531 length:123 start_codon:yes stop_codon:yes gene_type:complete
LSYLDPVEQEEKEIELVEKKESAVDAQEIPSMTQNSSDGE